MDPYAGLFNDQRRRPSRRDRDPLYSVHRLTAGTGRSTAHFTHRACVVTVFQALRVVPTKVYDRGGQRSWAARRPSEDIYRYIADIESEFEGHDPKKVLMDVGNWTYVPHNVLQIDRASPLAEQPCRHMYENFDPLLERIRGHEYEKILVQHYNTRWFLYDWDGWPRPTGVRQALLDHYEEVRVIPGASGVDVSPKIEHSGPVSVLVPRK